ncbi:MFS transporter [Phormidium tenue FACHB-886]|nr:MFS transporter [Phormidium tenue FACHB-886]
MSSYLEPSAHRPYPTGNGQLGQSGRSHPALGQVLRTDTGVRPDLPAWQPGQPKGSDPSPDISAERVPPDALPDVKPSSTDSSSQRQNRQPNASEGSRGTAPDLNLYGDFNDGSAPPPDSHNGSNGSYNDSPENSLEHGSDDEAPERGLLPVLRNRNFLTLWSGQVFSQLADKVYLVLMIAIIASRFQTADQTISGWVSSLMIAFTIPAILFGSVAGVFVDHWRKRAVLVSTNLLRGGLVLGLPVLLWISHSWGTIAGMPVGFLILLAVTFLVSTLTQFFAPAEQAVLPLIVERRHLLSANSLYTMTMMASVIVGFALGEPLLALADTVIRAIAPFLHLAPDMGKEILVGGSYALAGLLLMSMQTGEKTVSAHEDLPDVWENIRDGLRYLKHQSHVRAALIHLVILFSIFAALAVLVVRMAEVMPELKASQFGFLLAAGGVGMALGAVLIGQFGQRFSRVQLGLYGSVGIASCLAAISFFTQHLLPTLLLLLLLGVFAALTGVPMQTTIQEETPEAMRGKVFGLQNNAINIALSLPLALAGIAETWFGLQAVFLGLSLLAIVGGIFSWTLLKETLSSPADH